MRFYTVPQQFAVVRYCDNIPSGEAVMALIQEATELLRQSEDDGFSQNVSFQAKITATGERGRPRFIISRDQLTFLLDLGFKIASAMFDLNNTQTLVISRINYRQRKKAWENVIVPGLLVSFFSHGSSPLAEHNSKKPHCQHNSKEPTKSRYE